MPFFHTSRDLPACLYLTSQHSDLADPAMTMVGRIAPIVPGFSDAPSETRHALAKSYPTPATFTVVRAVLFHGFYAFEAH